MEEVWFLPKRAVPCQPKHVDVIADKHDVPNLRQGFGLSLPLSFEDLLSGPFEEGQHYLEQF